MKKRLIALFTLGRSLDQTKDRGGKYSLRKVNQFARLGPGLKVSTPKAEAATAVGEPVKADAQPMLFEGAEQAPGTEGANPTDLTDATPPAKQAPQARPFPWGKLKAVPVAVVKFLAKPAVLLLGKLSGPAPDIRPRAQAELALEKVTVLRNDLSEADVMVVAKERKPLSLAEPKPATGTNTWTKATARWIKLKDTAEGETRADLPRPSELAETPP